MKGSFIPNKATMPLFIFPDVQNQQWFRVETPMSNPNGIKACLHACTECIPYQTNSNSPKWLEFQKTIEKATEILTNIEKEEGWNTSSDGGTYNPNQG